ncbi:hypothetical protein GCM10010228_70500 [Streptomyces massasporeus]|nr:hypothetical protein GCM10010228_70500 [Streptomyces massasporeus]
MEKTEAVGAGDGSRIGFVHAAEHPQQSGLADAILPDEADPVAGGGGQTDAVEDTSAAQGADEVVGEQGMLGHSDPSRM